jgi:hypothetical protein
MWALTTRTPDRELVSLQGRVLVHDSRPELEWLIPGWPVVELKGDSPEEIADRLGRPVMLWKDHPGMAGIRWPLDRKDFVA